MQIVIEIPDEMYAEMMDENCIETMIIPYKDFIKNGTPLPKGHGRLKDFDKIEWYGCDFEGRGCIEAKGDCSVCSHANCDANQVRGLPTIIEADRSEG